MSKFLYFLSFLILLGVGYYIYVEVTKIEVTATGLADLYEVNKERADDKYLNEVIYVRGHVKAFYKLLGTRTVLELQTNNDIMNLFCFFPTLESEFEASQLLQDEYVTIKGKCLGLDAYSFVKGIKIEVEEIIKE